MNKSQQYVAFLRGINVGRNTTVKMEELKKAFAELGFTSVRTVLNSGNVIFEGSPESILTLTGKIEERLKQKFGFDIKVLLRSGEEIRELIASNSFKDCQVTPDTRLNVTLLPESAKASLENSGKDFQILSQTAREICWLVILSPGHRTPEAMAALEKQFGKQITTRTWNTILKIGKLCEDSAL